MGAKKETTGKAYQVKLSVNAIKNIDEITAYIAFINHQPINAIKIVERIFELIDSISKNPFAFRECEEIPTKTKMYRKAICLKWYIIYKVTNTSITILGIIHSSRKPSIIKTLKNSKE